MLLRIYKKTILSTLPGVLITTGFSYMVYLMDWFFNVNIMVPISVCKYSLAS